MSDVFSTDWASPPKDLGIGADEVHVWLVYLGLADSAMEECWSVLNMEEQERARRFLFAMDQHRFIVAHGALRSILGAYLRISPEQLYFVQNTFGKPYLAKETGGEILFFNLSHSSSLALIAVAMRREVGIDIEWMREDFARREIAARFFSPKENEELFSLEKSLQKKAFFDCWTRKEAYVKARGEGLSIPLHQFDVSVAPDKPAQLISSREKSALIAQWTVQDLFIGDQYSAALVLEGQDCKIRCWKWAGEKEVRYSESASSHNKSNSDNSLTGGF